MTKFKMYPREMHFDQPARTSEIFSTPEVAKGTEVYAVVHNATSLEFNFAYTDPLTAERIAEKFSGNPPAIEPNFSKVFIVVTDRKPEDVSL